MTDGQPIRRLTAVANRLLPTPITRYHLIRFLAFWLVIHIAVLCVVHQADRELTRLRPTFRGVPLITLRVTADGATDLAVALAAALVYTTHTLRRRHHAVLLANLGMSRVRLVMLLTTVAFGASALTWGVR